MEAFCLPVSKIRKGLPSPKFGSLRNIEIIGNTLTNTKGLRPAYFAAVAGMRDPNYFWGTALDSVEVRNNSITGRPGTPRADFHDGYTNDIHYADPDGPWSPNGTASTILGTIFQGNSCTNCSTFYNFGTGVSDTIVWNSIVNGAAGVTPAISNTKFGSTPGAVGTVLGHD